MTLRPVAITLAALCLALFAQDARSEPNRDSLIAAWEAHIRALPGTESLEETGEDSYRLEDTDLPYDGGLTIKGLLVRSAETPGYETGFSHLGMVEFELVDLPEERLTSQVYYYWLADRQTLHYSKETQGWVDSTTYRDAISSWYPDTPSLGLLTFMASYGIWIILGVILVFAFVAIGRQTRKAQALMDDSASLNEKGRENLDRAEKMQDEVLAIARETRDLHRETNDLLRQMRDSLQR